jgi:hypothetical protein
MTDHAEPSTDLATSPLMRRVIVILMVLLAIVIFLGSGQGVDRLLHWSGETLLATGILMAAKGISDVRRAWTKLPGWSGILAAQAKGRRDQGARSFWSAWNVLADRRWISQLGVRQRRPAVRAVGAMTLAKATVSATATVIRTPPPAESSAEERLAWLESRMVTAYAQLDVLHEAGQQESKDRTTAVEQEQADRTADTRGIRDNLANLAGGGLRLQTWGVVCLLVGTALTAFYP